MKKQLTLRAITVLVATGELEVQFERQVLRDDGAVHSRGQFHRFVVAPGEDFNAIVADHQKHFEDHEATAMDPNVHSQLSRMIANEHTPERIAAQRAKEDARKAADEQARKSALVAAAAQAAFAATPEGKAAAQAVEKARKDADAEFLASDEGKAMVEDVLTKLRGIARARGIA